ncbi:alpha/beta hydrolase [Kordiimonas lipolytica]|uniref:Alpha/beta hydrolase n=1 Tax=Kordiimonas lipolytica TaxID=1662421 RepID=A0ABV8UB93_9PROT
MAEKTQRVILVPAVADGLLHLDCKSDGASDAVWGIAAKAEEAIVYGRKQQAAKLDACLSRVREALDNGSFDPPGTLITAGQLYGLREKLGIQGWHLFAESYGARVSLALATLDRTGTLSQTLDSPETPWVDGFWHAGRNFFNALKELSSYCRSHFYCPAKRGRLERDLLRGIAQQNAATAAPVALKNIITGQIAAYAKPTREQLLISSFHALRTPARAAILPYIGSSPENMRERFGLLLDQLLFPGDGLNTGMHHLIRCSELPMAIWYRALEDDRLEYPEMAPFLSYLAWRQQYACNAIAVTPPEAFQMPDLPRVPSLVLSGELDPVTPPSVVETAFRGSSSYFIRRYRALGHVTHAQKECVMEDVLFFWESPSSPPKRSACSSDDLALRFYSPVVVR